MSRLKVAAKQRQNQLLFLGDAFTLGASPGLICSAGGAGLLFSRVTAL
jgi:hypothetical protein